MTGYIFYSKIEMILSAAPTKCFQDQELTRSFVKGYNIYYLQLRICLGLLQDRLHLSRLHHITFDLQPP